MLRKVSIFWVILAALALTSALPIGVIAFLEVGSAHDEVEREAKTKLNERVDAEAVIINQQLEQFRLTTDLAASQAQKLLTRQVGTVITDEEVQRRLENYGFSGPDTLFGKDEWFDTEYAPVAQDDHVSNAFLEDGRELTPDVEYTIAVTEGLDPLFGVLSDSIERTTQLGAHNLFLVTNNGVMRLYPFAYNTLTPVGPFTEVQEFVYSGPEENPERASVWSLLQLDTFDGHLFIANAIPIYDGDTYLGVMVHDLDLARLSQTVTGFDIGEQGLAFVIDHQGFLVMHPDYQPSERWLELDEAGREALIRDGEAFDAWYSDYFDVELSDLYPDIAVDQILGSDQGTLEYSRDDQDWFLTYQSIPETGTGWRLVLMQPRAELIQTATTISSRVQRAALIMVALVAVASVILARQITWPVLRLSDTAQKIEESVNQEAVEAIGKNVAQLGDIPSLREIHNLSQVLEQMVLALQHRMVELDSIYAMGQTITASVDYEATLKAILSAIQQVVKFDAAEIGIKRGNQLVVDAWAGNAAYKNTTGHEYTVGQGVIGQMAQSNELVFLPDVPKESEFAMETEQRDVRSLLAIPLTMGERLVGAMILVHHEPGYFTEDAKRQLKKLAAQASVAVENAQKVRERESALKRQIEELKVEIDQSKRQAQVAEISDSDFFRNLQSNAAKLRQRSANRTKKDQEATAESSQTEPPAEGNKPESTGE